MKDRRNKGYDGLSDDEATNRIVNKVKFNTGQIKERRKANKDMSERVFVKIPCDSKDPNGAEHMLQRDKKLVGSGEYYIKDVLAEQITNKEGKIGYRFYNKIGDPYELLSGDEGLDDTLKKMVVAVMGSLREHQEGDKKSDRTGYFTSLKTVLTPVLTLNKDKIYGRRYQTVQDIDDWSSKSKASGLYFSIASKFWTDEEALFMSLSTKLVREARKHGISIKVPSEKKVDTSKNKRISKDEFASMFSEAGFSTSDRQEKLF